MNLWIHNILKKKKINSNPSGQVIIRVQINKLIDVKQKFM